MSRDYYETGVSQEPLLLEYGIDKDINSIKIALDFRRTI